MLLFAGMTDPGLARLPEAHDKRAQGDCGGTLGYGMHAATFSSSTSNV